jgi:hypothetical protein
VSTVKIAYLVLVLALLAPATASAQTPPPDERAAARAFADAAGRFTDAIEAPSKALFGWVEHPLRRAPGCPRIAKKHREGAIVLMLYTHTLEFARDIKPALNTLRSELANVPTADPALISGRAAWRSTGRSVEAAPEPGDLCAELRAWRRAGYPDSTVRKVTRQFVHLADTEGASVARKQNAAVDRMVELGVPRAEARLFADPYRDPEELWDGS